MQHRLLAAALAAAMVGTAACAAGDSAKSGGADGAALTIYHADDDALFSGDAQGALESGHAVVHEQRSIDVRAGRHTLRVGGLDQSIRIEVFGELHQFGALGKTVTMAELQEKV